MGQGKWLLCCVGVCLSQSLCVAILSLPTATHHQTHSSSGPGLFFLFLLFLGRLQETPAGVPCKEPGQEGSPWFTILKSRQTWDPGLKVRRSTVCFCYSQPPDTLGPDTTTQGALNPVGGQVAVPVWASSAGICWAFSPQGLPGWAALGGFPYVWWASVWSR